MLKFRKGAAYRFEYGRRESAAKAAGETARKSAKYTFDRKIKGDGVMLYLFHHALAGYRESFTPEQLGDHAIKEVA